VTEGRDLFLSALRMLGRSAARLERHHRALAPLMPLDASRLESLDDPALTQVEAMLKKFDQFVDDLRRRAFRGVLTLAAEPVETMNQRQVLERLETLGCIASVRAFLSLLTLRNRLAHEYPNQLDVQASSVTDAWRAIPELLAMLDRCASTS
jgi:hypothetical protein